MTTSRVAILVARAWVVALALTCFVNRLEAQAPVTESDRHILRSVIAYLRDADLIAPPALIDRRLVDSSIAARRHWGAHHIGISASLLPQAFANGLAAGVDRVTACQHRDDEACDVSNSMSIVWVSKPSLADDGMRAVVRVVIHARAPGYPQARAVVMTLERRSSTPNKWIVTRVVTEWIT